MIGQHLGIVLGSNERNRQACGQTLEVIQIILQEDCLKSHAFERGDDDLSVYELCKSALTWPGGEDEDE